VAVYPLLTTEPEADHVRAEALGSADTFVDRGQIYIQPPTETKLLVTIGSQQMTDMLLAELSRQAFKVKELPVEVPEEWGGSEDGNPMFYISIALLDHLREHFDLQAILIGNVYFRGGRRDWGVSAAYMRLVDIETLDVLCHVTVEGGDFSLKPEECVRDIAEQLARLAGLNNSSR
jgi:hypothetical protein